MHFDAFFDLANSISFSVFSTFSVFSAFCTFSVFSILKFIPYFSNMFITSFATFSPFNAISIWYLFLGLFIVPPPKKVPLTNAFSSFSFASILYSSNIYLINILCSFCIVIVKFFPTISMLYFCILKLFSNFANLFMLYSLSVENFIQDFPVLVEANVAANVADTLLLFKYPYISAFTQFLLAKLDNLLSSSLTSVENDITTSFLLQ